jgi:hypothetical protein
MRPALIEPYIPAWEQERMRRNEAVARFAEQRARGVDWPFWLGLVAIAGFVGWVLTR